MCACASAQIAPGSLPPEPPAQPGQVGAPNTPSATPTVPGANDTSTAATPSGYTIPINIRNVLVPTTVLDPDGHGYVNGLTATDFEVYDNDKPQKVTAEYSQSPLSVVLVVQANSEVEPMLPKIKRTGVLLQGLVTGQEGDVAVLAFDHRMQVIQDFTNDPTKLDDAMQKITSGSSTAAIIDAVWKADGMLKAHDRQNVRRRVIILMTRDIDKGSEAHLNETVRAIQFDNVIVESVNISKFLTSLMKKPDYPRPANGGIPPEALPSPRGNISSDTTVLQEQTGNALNTIPPIYRGIKDLFKRPPAYAFAYFTGGNVYSFATEHGLEDAITDIGKALNSQYLLSYNPNDKNESGFHKIRVAVDRPGLKVQTRPGYWWGGGVQ